MKHALSENTENHCSVFRTKYELVTFVRAYDLHFLLLSRSSSAGVGGVLSEAFTCLSLPA